MNRKDHNQYVLRNNYAECFIYNLKNEPAGSFLIDIEDIEQCKKHHWSIIESNNYKRVVTYINNKRIVLHKYIINYYGKNPIDHINRNTLDNRKSNLRIVTECENNANKDFKNIWQQKNGKYRVVIVRYGVRYHVGYFDTEEESIAARDAKLKEIANNAEADLQKYIDKGGFKATGISPSPSGKWRAFYGNMKTRKAIGTFETFELAKQAREEYINKVSQVNQELTVGG